jgi:hypothetical protein
MTALVLTEDNLRVLKRELRDFFPDAKSSHLSEALAAAVGKRTHAALLADLASADPADPMILPLDEDAFVGRLRALGCDPGEDAARHGIQPFLPIWDDGILIDTTPHRGDDIAYKTPRERAWRNMMVSAINAAIERKLLSVRPGDNRWPGHEEGRGHTFEFTFGDAVPAAARVNDAGFDEIGVSVALWPKDLHWLRANNAGFHAGEAFASGWLERRDAAYLQSSMTLFNIRKRLVGQVSDVVIAPKGYGDHGRVIM